jgi:CsoR family transcriptional regulator, copper-sensing transcriptional repressor
MLATQKKAEVREYLTPHAQKALADRLARAEGHVRSIRQMVVDHRCADEILIQIAAVKAALNQTAANLIDSEMRSCVGTCMEGTDDERLARVTRALAAVLKSS